MSLSAAYTIFLKTSRDGKSITSQGSLFQYLTTLSEKKFILISNLSVSCTYIPAEMYVATWMLHMSFCTLFSSMTFWVNLFSITLQQIKSNFCVYAGEQ